MFLRSYNSYNSAEAGFYPKNNINTVGLMTCANPKSGLYLLINALGFLCFGSMHCNEIAAVS